MHDRPTVMRRLLIRSKRRVLIASDYLERPVERPYDKVDRAQPIAIDRARSFHVARWSLETGTSVPVEPMWTRATGRELVAIDRARFGKVSCGHGLLSGVYARRSKRSHLSALECVTVVDSTTFREGQL